VPLGIRIEGGGENRRKKKKTREVETDINYTNWTSLVTQGRQPRENDRPWGGKKKGQGGRRISVRPGR